MEQRSKQLGFSHVAMWAASALPLATPKLFAFNNASAEWQQEYALKNYLLRDPIIRHGLNCSRLAVLDEAFFQKDPQFWQSAHEHGLCYGVSQSTRGFDGTTYILAICREEEPVSAAEVEAIGEPFAHLLHMMANLLEEVIGFPHRQQDTPVLSKREVEVLRWTADGKTASEIAMILNISERTVNFHINNSIQKLNAVNKTQALVKAVVLNLL